MMKFGLLAASILFVSCLVNPNSTPEISPTQIEKIKAELRLAKYSSFTKNELDTLPKNIQVSDTAIKNIFEREQVNGWLMLTNFPKGVQATIVVSTTETRAGKTSEKPSPTILKVNTCCVDNWNGSTWMQLHIPFWNDVEALPYKLVYEAKIQEELILKDSIMIN